MSGEKKWPDARVKYELHEHLARNNIHFDSHTSRDQMIDLLERHGVSYKDVMADGRMDKESKLPFPPKATRDASPETNWRSKRQKTQDEGLPKAELEFLEDEKTPTLLPNLWRLPEPERKEILISSGQDFKNKYPERDIFQVWFYADHVIEEYGISDAGDKKVNEFIDNPLQWDTITWGNDEDDVVFKKARMNKALKHLQAFRNRNPKPSNNSSGGTTGGTTDGTGGTGGTDGTGGTTGGTGGTDGTGGTTDGTGGTTDGTGGTGGTDGTDGTDGRKLPDPVDNKEYDSKERREWRSQFHGRGSPDANRMEVKDPETGEDIIADILGRHPIRKTWLAIALPSLTKEYPKLSRGYYINAAAVHPQAYSRYVMEGSNITLSTATHKSQMENCSFDNFELNLVLCMPWGEKWHYQGLGIPHYVDDRDFMLWSKGLLVQCWKSAAMEVLHDHMIKAGQSIPITSNVKNRIKPKSWRK